MDDDKFLTSGCPKLDSILRGGIARKGITQIYGGSGCGKTQLALQLCLTVQQPVSEGGCKACAIYICTEDVFPTKRLQELLEHSELAQKFGATGDMIFVNHVTDIEDLENCIIRKIPSLMTVRKVGLLVIDSITAPYRAEYSNTQLKSRAKSLRSIGHQLHRLAADHKMTVACINQVSATIGSSNPGSVSTKEQPALGITWANMVTNTLYLHRTGRQRCLSVTQSPYIQRCSIEFMVSQGGISGIG